LAWLIPFNQTTERVITVRHDPGREWSKLNTVGFQDLTSSRSFNNLQAFLALLEEPE
jgi:hypothetical protein